MARFVWKPNVVFSMALKDGSYVLGQLLKSPYLVFFDSFRDNDDWEADSAQKAKPLFFCAVTRQFTRYSPIEKRSEILPRQFEKLPRHWISQPHGSREVTLWKGTKEERTIMLLSDRPAGSLVEEDIESRGAGNPRVVKRSIPLDDDRTIDEHELDGIWLYPQLNERLFLSKQEGHAVDPLKDLAFSRPPKKQYATFYDMLAFRGTPEDWGYSSKPYGGSGKTKSARRKSR